MPALFQWLHTVSFFHAAFEALAVNELRYLQLHEEKYGVNIDVPAAAILSTFGLRAGVSVYLCFGVLSQCPLIRWCHSRSGGQTSPCSASSLARSPSRATSYCTSM